MSSPAEPCRSRLLARNLKLRHLRGLSLRNLRLPPATHAPELLAALPESGPSSCVPLSSGREVEKLRRLQHQPRPLPRRSSLSMAHATPLARQNRLEVLVDGSVADVFFSLHLDTDAEPFYSSEVGERSANFNFRFFDLSKLPPSVSRSPSVTIRFWAKRRPQPSWHLFLEEEVCLDRLNFIASPIGRRFLPNALLFHLQDGLYSLDFPSVPTEPKQGPAVATSSYSALMKLATLEGSIQDAMQTRQRIVGQIDRLLEQSPADTTDCARQEATLASKYVARQQRANRLALERRNELQLSLDRRRKAMEEGRRWQAQAEEDVADNRPKLEAAKKLLRETEYRIRGQRRRICSDLSNIFPIVPMLEAPPLSFRICNLPLPNSAYDGSTARAINEDALSAALGLATLLTHHLQFYLSRPLPYPLHPHGSRSFARDEISLLPDGVAPRTRREFPLYLPRGGSAVGHWRFEYGWFLLNKDIEALCASQGLRLVDIRHSLPNLKYLLYVCSAGSDELPQRKKGGVRGLWAGRLEAETPTETGSRSDGRTPSPAPPPPAPTRTDGLAGDPSSDPSPPLRLSWAGGQTDFTLRTKGLRENTAP